MKVWIDGDLCTGVGLCESACPDVFIMANDGIAHVMDAAKNALPSRTSVDFAEAILEDVLEAAEACPEECIYIEN
jgi:ferredoxin